MISFLLFLSFSSFFSSNFMSLLPFLLPHLNNLILPQSSDLLHQSQCLLISFYQDFSFLEICPDIFVVALVSVCMRKGGKLGVFLGLLKGWNNVGVGLFFLYGELSVVLKFSSRQIWLVNRIPVHWDLLERSKWIIEFVELNWPMMSNGRRFDFKCFF